MINECHERRTLPGAGPSQDTRMLLGVMRKNRLLLVGGLIGHFV
jgi:hypothetical protein